MPRIIPSLLLLFAIPAKAQQTAPAPAPVYGSVTGHITCVDTNQPARLASVTLQTIDIKPEPSPSSTAPRPAMMRTYQSTLDGSFYIPKVTPGTYYVVIRPPATFRRLSALRKQSSSNLPPRS